MLEPLRWIVESVNRAASLEDALDVIVREVKRTIGADVCSIYLTDAEQREHVLQATDGLRPEAVGRVRLPLNRGLIGWVTERADVVNLDDARRHARYLFVSESGEDRFQGFLGAPIIQNRKVLGVLVLRQQRSRRFDEDAVTFVVTLAAQLAAAIALARNTGELGRLRRRPGLSDRFLAGVAAAPGIAFGTAYVVYPPADLDAVPDKTVSDIAAEIALFRAALKGATEDVCTLVSRVGGSLREEDRALFDAWRMMLESDLLIGGTEKRIRAGNWAQAAWRDTIAEHAAVFRQMDDAYLRERGSDVRDLGRQVLMRLQKREAPTARYPGRTILVGDEISAMQVAEVPRGRLAGVVSSTGSGSSHMAIVARGIGVPAAMGVVQLPVSRIEGQEVIVDGYRGRVYVSPAQTVRAEYERLAADDRELSAELEALRGLPPETTDGFELTLYL
ncbi:MAG: phosphoenolpyruvate-utilizing N-terminal domain-containing protein, partial [Thiohalocapsa sp.]